MSDKPAKDDDGDKPEKLNAYRSHRFDMNDQTYRRLIHWLAVNWNTIKPIEGTKKMRWNTREFTYIMQRVYGSNYRENVSKSLWRRITVYFWHYFMRHVNKVLGSENMLKALNKVVAPANYYFYCMYTDFCRNLLDLRTKKGYSRKLRYILAKIAKNPNSDIPEEVLELALPRTDFSEYDYVRFNISLQKIQGTVARMKFAHYFMGAPHVMPPYIPPDEDLVLPSYLRYDENEEELNEEEKKIYEMKLRSMKLLETDLINGLRSVLEICKKYGRDKATNVNGMVSLFKKMIFKITLGVADRHPTPFSNTAGNDEAYCYVIDTTGTVEPSPTADTFSPISAAFSPISAAPSPTTSEASLTMITPSADGTAASSTDAASDVNVGASTSSAISSPTAIKSVKKGVFMPTARGKYTVGTRRKGSSWSTHCRQEQPPSTSSTANNESAEAAVENIIRQQLQAPVASRVETADWARQYSWQGAREPQSAQEVVAGGSSTREVPGEQQRNVDEQLHTRVEFFENVVKDQQAHEINNLPTCRNRSNKAETKLHHVRAEELLEALKKLNRSLIDVDPDAPVNELNLKEENIIVTKEQTGTISGKSITLKETQNARKVAKELLQEHADAVVDLSICRKRDVAVDSSTLIKQRSEELVREQGDRVDDLLTRTEQYCKGVVEKQQAGVADTLPASSASHFADEMRAQQTSTAVHLSSQREEHLEEIVREQVDSSQVLQKCSGPSNDVAMREQQARANELIPIPRKLAKGGSQQQMVTHREFRPREGRHKVVERDRSAKRGGESRILEKSLLRKQASARQQPQVSTAEELPNYKQQSYGERDQLPVNVLSSYGERSYNEVNREQEEQIDQVSSTSLKLRPGKVTGVQKQSPKTTVGQLPTNQLPCYQEICHYKVGEVQTSLKSYPRKVSEAHIQSPSEISGQLPNWSERYPINVTREQQMISHLPNKQEPNYQVKEREQRAKTTEILLNLLKSRSSKAAEAAKRQPKETAGQLPSWDEQVSLPFNQVPNYQDIGRHQHAATTKILSTLLKSTPRMATETQQQYPSAIAEQLPTWGALHPMNVSGVQQPVSHLPYYQERYHQGVGEDQQIEATEIPSTLLEPTPRMATETQPQYPSAIAEQLPSWSALHQINVSGVQQPVSHLPYYQGLYQQDVRGDQQVVANEIPPTLLKSNPRIATETQQQYPPTIAEQLPVLNDLHPMNVLREQRTVRQLPYFQTRNQDEVKREKSGTTTEVSPTLLNPTSWMTTGTEQQYPSTIAGQLPNWSDQHPINISEMQWPSRHVPYSQELYHQDVGGEQHAAITEVSSTLIKSNPRKAAGAQQQSQSDTPGDLSSWSIQSHEEK